MSFSGFLNAFPIRFYIPPFKFDFGISYVPGPGIFVNSFENNSDLLAFPIAKEGGIFF